MSDAALNQLAEAAGIAVRWTDAGGNEHRVAPDTLRAVLSALDLPCSSDTNVAESISFCKSQRTHEKPQMEIVHSSEAVGGRWGVAVQLYGLRRDGDLGVGDLGMIADLLRPLAAYGADAIALSPLHALFAADPARRSPYSPSHRLMLNPLYADADLLPDVPVPALAADIAHDRLVDWPLVAERKFARLRRTFDMHRQRLTPELDTYRCERGDMLRHHAVFETLHAHFRRVAPDKDDWRCWPAPLRDPDSAEVRDFEREHVDEVEFHIFLQWLAERSLAATQAACRDAGFAIGIIADLAVGTDPAGSHAWSRQEEMLTGLSLGAPPDALNAQGQNWGLTGFSPRALGPDLRPWRDLLEATLRHVGGIRVDHVLGLARRWVIPAGAAPTEGAYLAYPFDALLGELAAAAHARDALVVGEDLGTVPPGFRARLRAAGVLGTDVLQFARDDAHWIAPECWNADAAAYTSTHDLPPLAGWWSGTDIVLRRAIGFVDDAAATMERRVRAADRRQLWRALCDAGVAHGKAPPPRRPSRFVDAAISFVARVPSPLLLVPLEDLLAETDLTNLPGTIDEHPNWRRRVAMPVRTLLDKTAPRRRLRRISKARPRR